MSEIKDYDATAGNNSSAAPDGAPEGMAPSGVNDTMREMMARMKRMVVDTLTSDSTTASTSGTTGAIQTDGGIGAVKDIVTDATFKPLGATGIGDAAAVGYNSTEGLLLTGQGSTSDVTIKNDAGQAVLSIPTGTRDIEVTAGKVVINQANSALELKSATLPTLTLLNTDTSMGDNQEMGAVDFYTSDSSRQGVSARMVAVADGTAGNTELEFHGYRSDALQLFLTLAQSGVGATFEGPLSVSGETAAANKLDDYEEGTFTLTIYDAPTGGNAGTNGADEYYYTKIGRAVHYDFYMVNLDTTGMTAGNDLYFRGLPFTLNSAPVSVGSVALNSFTFTGNFSLFASNNTTYMNIRESISGSAVDTVTVAEVSSGTSDIWGTQTYTGA